MPKYRRKGNWTKVAFGDVVRQVKDRVNPLESGLERYVAGEHMDTDDLRIRRWGIIGDGYLGPAFHMRFKPGQVLYGSRRTYLRKVALADFEGITANTTFVVESKNPDVLLPNLLPYIMQTECFHEHSIAQSKGSVNPYVNFSDLVWYEFALPPLEEQRRIVEMLRACQNCIERLRECEEEAQKAYFSLLASFFAMARLEDPRDSHLQTEEGHTWTWHRVDEIFELQLGKMSSRKSREGPWQAEYIKNNNVLWDTFELQNLPQMSFSEADRTKFELRDGDLLVCEGGEIGRAAIWKPLGREVFYQKALHRLRPVAANASPRFFLHYLRFCSLTGMLERIATGTTMPHLPREQLAALRLPFPEMERQLEIANALDSLQGARRSLNERHHLASSLLRRVLKESLT